MEIRDLSPDDEATIREVAELLIAGFQEQWPNAWPDLDAALAEVHESFAEGRLSRVAVDEQGRVLGWIGGIPQYDGHVWELHPLVVRASHRRQGIGRALVADLEEQVRPRGGITLFLGSDDEMETTSLGGVDLYPDPLAHLSQLRNLKDHPFTFYQKLGFVVVGVLPDANGPGKPDIFMAKRVNQDRSTG